MRKRCAAREKIARELVDLGKNDEPDGEPRRSPREHKENGQHRGRNRENHARECPRSPMDDAERGNDRCKAKSEAKRPCERQAGGHGFCGFRNTLGKQLPNGFVERDGSPEIAAHEVTPVFDIKRAEVLVFDRGSAQGSMAFGAQARIEVFFIDAVSRSEANQCGSEKSAQHKDERQSCRVMEKSVHLLPPQPSSAARTARSLPPRNS